MSDATSSSRGLGRRRWLILGVIGLAQLMVVLDLTIVNIALPSAQRALGFTTVDRQWVVTAYSLAFGSLLLLGGRNAAAARPFGRVQKSIRNSDAELHLSATRTHLGHTVALPSQRM
jgi:hypothetical protein